MPTFLTYYQSIKERKKRGETINTIARECDISYVTVQQKLRRLKNGKNTFSKLECERIAQILKMSVEELFPSEPALQNILSKY